MFCRVPAKTHGKHVLWPASICRLPGLWQTAKGLIFPCVCLSRVLSSPAHNKEPICRVACIWHTANTLFDMCFWVPYMYYSRQHTANTLFAVCPIYCTRQNLGHITTVSFPVVKPHNLIQNQLRVINYYLLLSDYSDYAESRPNEAEYENPQSIAKSIWRYT